MADKLLIHYDPADNDIATWSLVNSQGELLSMISKGKLVDAAKLATKYTTIILLDSKSVHLGKVKLPIKNRQKLLRALPFAFEEQIADDIDELHFVAGTTDANGYTPVVAIRHDTLNNLLHVLHSAGIEPVAILPDALCLAANTKQWAILLDQQQAILQLDRGHGLTIDRENLPCLLQSLAQDKTLSQPEKLFLFSNENDTDNASLDYFAEDIEIVPVSYNTDPLVVYCGQYQHALPLNLLQDAYKPTTKGSIEWKRWRLAASLAATWLVLILGYNSSQQYSLQNKNDSLRVQIDKIYKDTFPESRKIVDARVQMEQKLDALRGRGNGAAAASMIDLLSASASALSTEKNITLQAINYRNQKIDLELTSTSLETIESLNRKLNKGEISSEIVSSSSEKNLIKGNIRIQRKAS